MAESHDPKKEMLSVWIHKEFEEGKNGFKVLNDLLKSITGFLTGIDHISDHQQGPAINLDFYNILSNGERNLRSLLNNIENSDKLVKPKEVAPENLINKIDQLLNQSLTKIEFKASLTKLFKDYDIKETSIKQEKDLPF